METVLVGPAPRIAVTYAGKGPLLLFLHGIRGNKRNWHGQIEAFSKGFTAAAWDARGYGESDDYSGPLQFDHFTGDVLRVAEHFGAAKFHLVGLSMGGRIARNVALRSPERLHSLTLVSTTPGFDALSADEVKRFVTERRTNNPDAVRQLIGSRARREAIEELEDSLARVRAEPYRRTLEASVAQDRAAPIENIRVPTLVIAGDEDKVYPPSLAQSVAKRIPGAELVMVKGAGHLVNLERPGRFNEILLDFLKRRFA
ncbi:MAG TPA: alpha/beta fold hydrolase [Burkholderiales bacterium]|nr:alpha/beta fold hydrolase [Burkholderiales bacterium]